MSFNNYASAVRNPTHTMAGRRIALKHCIRMFSYLTQSSHTAICNRCDSLTGIFSSSKNSEQQLIATLNLLIRSRNRYLEKLSAIERKRIRQKMLGQRHLSKADRELLEKAQVIASALE